MSTFPLGWTEEKLRTNEEAARRVRALDLSNEEVLEGFMDVMFKSLLLRCLVDPGVTVDGLWGALEELQLKCIVLGPLNKDDRRKWQRCFEMLHQVGLEYVAAEPEEEPSSQGMLQVADVERLEARFPQLKPWGAPDTPRRRVRLRLHEYC